MTCSNSLPQNITIEIPLTNVTNTKVSDYAARSAGCGHSVGKGLASAPASLPTSPTLIFLTLQSLLLCRHRRVARFFYLPFFCVCDFPLPSRLLRKSEKSVKLCKKFLKALAKPLQNGNNYEVTGNSHKSKNTKKSLMIEFWCRQTSPKSFSFCIANSLDLYIA